MHVRLQLSLWWLGNDYSVALPLSLSVFQSLGLRNKSWKLCFDLHPSFTYNHLMFGSLSDSCAYFSFGSESAERLKLTMARIYWAFTMNQESKGLGNLGKMHQVTDWSVVKPAWTPKPVLWSTPWNRESVERWGQKAGGKCTGSPRELVLRALQTGANKVSVLHATADLPALTAPSRGIFDHTACIFWNLFYFKYCFSLLDTFNMALKIESTRV